MSIQIDLEATGDLNGSILIESVRQWRSDCAAGQFKIGASTMRGPKLDMELIGASLSEGEYFGYPCQSWLAVLFVDPDGVLSSILFKTESLDNFEELRRSMRVKGESLLGKTIRAIMCKRSSRQNGGNYYAVEFEVTSNGKYAEQIKLFRAMNSPERFLKIDKLAAVIQPAEVGNDKPAGYLSKE